MGLLAQHAYGKSQKIEIGLSNNSLCVQDYCTIG